MKKLLKALKFMFLLPIFPMFAVSGDDDGIEFDMPDIGDDDGVEFGNEDDDGIEVYTGEPDEKPPEDNKPDTKTFTGDDIRKAVEAERKKWKNKLNKSITQPITSTTFNEGEFLEKKISEYIEDGYPEGTAKIEARRDLNYEKRLRDIESKANDRNDSTKLRRDFEVDQLSRDAYYADLKDPDIREEVEEYANKKGVSMEEAYNAKFAKSKRLELEKQIEQRLLNEQRKKKSADVDYTSNGEQGAKPKVKLTGDQLAAAKMLNMTPQEYYEFSRIDSLDQYNRITKKKG